MVDWVIHLHVNHGRCVYNNLKMQVFSLNTQFYYLINQLHTQQRCVKPALKQAVHHFEAFLQALVVWLDISTTPESWPFSFGAAVQGSHQLISSMSVDLPRYEPLSHLRIFLEELNGSISHLGFRGSRSCRWTLYGFARNRGINK
jgi:hypothetical protein